MKNNGEQRLAVFWLSLAGFYKRGSCWLLLAGLCVFAGIVPLLTPWDEQPHILQPARAQAAWGYVWLALFTWLPFQAATLGRRLRVNGFLEFMKARGRHDGALYLQMGMAVSVWLLGLLVLACIICALFCSPKDPREAEAWRALLAQYGALVLASGTPLCLLGVALGTRAGEVVAYLVPVCLLFCGLIGASWLGPLLIGCELPAYRIVWLLLPHYHLADLTSRLVFKMGALTPSAFRDALVYLFLQGASLTLLGRCALRIRS